MIPSHHSLLLCYFCVCSIVSLAQENLLETVVQTGHYETVTSLRFSDDGKYLLSGSDDNTLKIWELSSGREVRTFFGSTYPIQAFDISSDNRWIATVNGDSSVWIWDTFTGTLLRKIKSEKDIINNVIFHPSEQWVITGNKNVNVTVWDVETGLALFSLEGQPIGCYTGRCKVDLDVTKDGKFLIGGVGDRTLIVWDLKKREQRHVLKRHKGSCSSCMTSVSLINNDTWAASVSNRDSIRIWNLKNGQPHKEIFSERGFEFVVGSPIDDKLCVIRQSQLEVIDVSNQKVLLKLGDYSNGYETAAFSPDGKFLAISGKQKTIEIYRTTDFRKMDEFSGVINQFEDSLQSNIRTWVKNRNSQVLSPSGKIVARGKMGYIARLWDVNSGRILKDLEGHGGPVLDLSFSPDGNWLATASGDGTARIWNVETGEEHKVLRYHRSVVFSVKFSPNGEHLVTTSWDGLSVIWDAKTGRAISRYRSHDPHSPLEAVLYPGSLYVISSGLDQKLMMIERDTGKPVREFVGHSNHIVSLDLSSDGKQLLSGSWDGLAKVWNLETGFQSMRLDVHDAAVFDVAYSQDDEWIATASGDKTIGLWNAKTGELVNRLYGHRGAVTSVSFDPSQGRLISGSRDGTTRVWDVSTGELLFTHIFTGNTDWIVTLPSGHFYATEGARASVFFVRGLETYSIDRFFEEFYKPGLLDEIGVQKNRDLKGASLLERLEQFPPPEINIITPQSPIQTEEASIEITARVQNNGGGVAYVRVLHNGKIVIDDSKDLDRLKNGKGMYKIYDLKLIPGRNQVELMAVNEAGIESEKRMIEVFLPGDAPVSNCYIFSVGINEYRNTALNLNYAVADAKEFTTELKRRSKPLFKNIETIELYNQEASRENILKELRALIERVELNDVFYFYYAGHGSLVSGDFYFIPYDVARLYDEETLISSALSASEVNAIFREIKALKQVVVMDACHSGGSTELLADRGAGEEKALAQLSRSAGIHVLAAAGSEQTATEFKELGHGLFTYMILKALDGEADGAPRDNRITVYELKSFLDSTVPEYSEKYKGVSQFPSTFSRGQDFPIGINKK